MATFARVCNTQVDQLVSESLWMGKLKLQQSASSMALVKQSLKYAEHARQLEGALGKYKALVAQIPERLVDVLSPMLNDMQNTFEPGMRSLSWLSTNIEDYIEKLFEKLEQCKHFLITILDLVTVRISDKLNEVRATQLCAIPPHGESWGVSEFEAHSKNLCKTGATSLEYSSHQIERSVKHLISHITDHASNVSDDAHFLEACEELNKAYVLDLSAALTTCIRTSVDVLKRRAGQKLIKYGRVTKGSKPEDPVICAAVTLILPEWSWAAWWPLTQHFERVGYYKEGTRLFTSPDWHRASSDKRADRGPTRWPVVVLRLSPSSPPPHRSMGAPAWGD